jgi:hypothetical protein
MEQPPEIRPRTPANDTCPHCGAAVPDAAKGCRPLFVEVSFRQMSDREVFSVHRLTVDAYALQHPDEYCKSARSLAAHLTGLCWAFEYDASPQVARALKKWLDGNPGIDRLVPTEFQGSISIADVHGTQGPGEHVEAARKWARSVWEAWAQHHDQARRWVEEAQR